MTHPDNPFGPFKNDDHRLEAVRLREARLRLRERRRLWLGIAVCIAFTVVGLYADHPAAITASFYKLFKAFSR